MSSDVFERNVEKMIRRAGLRPDEARAKERFLRGLDAPQERKSWKLAAAAAAILVSVTIVWSARSERPIDRTTGQATPPKPAPREPRPIPARGGNDLLVGQFVLREKMQPPSVIFSARTTDHPGPSAFPDGTVFSVRLHKRSEMLQDGRLVAFTSETRAGSEIFKQGELSLPWTYRGPEMVVVEVLLNPELQERDVAKALKVPESKRTWVFEAGIWNQDVLGRLESQYPELIELVRDLRAFVGRVEEACASEELFKSRQKELVAEAATLQSRAFALGRSSLFPASAVQMQFAARDFVTLIPTFRWASGKFATPTDYHSGKVAATFRGDAFGFDQYRRYADEALPLAGREFLLWLLRDADLAGFEEAHRKLLRDHAARPGIEDFAPRLLQLPVVGADYPALEAELRTLKK
jgi:hypothetical protein